MSVLRNIEVYCCGTSKADTGGNAATMPFYFPPAFSEMLWLEINLLMLRVPQLRFSTLIDICIKIKWTKRQLF